MRRTLMLLTTLLALGGCATSSDPKPSVCDGKHRRPANPYGSVLPIVSGSGPATMPMPMPTTPSAKPAPSRKLGPLSRIDPQSFGPCGRTA